jgi:hypothetical protein
MRFVFRWRSNKAAAPADECGDRLRDILSVARRTRYYRQRRMAGSTQGLARVPRVEMNYFISNPEDFYNWGAPVRPLRMLDCPLRRVGKTAVLTNRFLQSNMVRGFDYAKAGELASFSPESLAGPIDKLRAVAEAVLCNRLSLRSLRHAVIPFTGLKHGSLSQEDRDLFWRAFQVPVFEQFRGFSNELLAWECEAHNGLHIVVENAIFETQAQGAASELLVTCLNCTEYTVLRLATELVATIDSAPCGCGHTAPRIVNMHRKPMRRAAVASVGAASGLGNHPSSFRA